MVRRGMLLILLVLSTVPGYRPAGAATARLSSLDRGLLTAASLRLSRGTPRHVASWLRSHRAVRSALVGLDGRTLEVRFRDGMRAAILPAAISPARLPARLVRPMSRSLAPARADGARAAVLEPFATQLNLGIHDGDTVAADLQAAGFQVDQAYDGAVTVNSMASLSRYSVVYMVAHVGVNPEGEAVVATGQPVDDDPSVAPLIQEGSVMTVEVAGTSQQYYGILSTYIRTHEDAFPRNTLVFVNGCGLLRGSLFWEALHAKGVRALVGWDQESMSRDESIAGGAFFGALAGGMTVADAVNAVRSQGYGTSVVDGQTAQFGYVGDGTMTLPEAIPPPTPTPLPTATPAPTAVPKQRFSVDITSRLPRVNHSASLSLSVRDTAHHSGVKGAFVVVDAGGVGIRGLKRGMTDGHGAVAFGNLKPLRPGAISIAIGKAGFRGKTLWLPITR